MIVELANIVSSHHEIWKILAHHNTVFPAPATEDNIHQPLRKSNSWIATDVSHGSIEENVGQMISIPRKFLLERTTSQTPHGGIHGRCDDLSMDQVERATVGYLFAIDRLSRNLSVP